MPVKRLLYGTIQKRLEQEILKMKITFFTQKTQKIEKAVIFLTLRMDITIKQT